MHCILQDFEFGGLSRVSGRGLHVFDNFLLAHKFIRTEVILMCTILIIGSGGFLGRRLAAEHSKRMFLNNVNKLVGGLGPLKSGPGLCPLQIILRAQLFRTTCVVICRH